MFVQLVAVWIKSGLNKNNLITVVSSTAAGVDLIWTENLTGIQWPTSFMKIFTMGRDMKPTPQLWEHTLTTLSPLAIQEGANIGCYNRNCSVFETFLTGMVLFDVNYEIISYVRRFICKETCTGITFTMKIRLKLNTIGTASNKNPILCQLFRPQACKLFW